MGQRVWFTSDTHWGHARVIQYANRPYSSVEEMDEALIRNWNEVVQHGDLVYHLGDLSFHKPEQTCRILARLNGQKYLIFGNHDKDARREEGIQSHFVWCRDYAEIDVPDPNPLIPGAKKPRQKIILTHYSMRVWNRSHHGSFNLYGHSHGTLYDDPKLLSMDVGVDPNGYYPVSYEEVKRRMSQKRWEPIDHHGAGRMDD